MPKSRIHNKAKTQILNNQRKLRVGTRKSGKAAHLMSTADLLTALTSSTHNKSHNNIVTVLNHRGVDINNT